MKIVSINQSPEQKASVIGKLQDDLCDVLEAFIEANGELPICVAVGVLEFLKHNLIARTDSEE